MNPYKNISVFRDEIKSFPEKEDYDIAYKHLKQENDRLQHLTTVLIDHIWKTGERGLPLQDIDRQMKLFDVRVGGL
jgi:hypothetical protein